MVLKVYMNGLKCMYGERFVNGLKNLFGERFVNGL